jgi:hypothetical protein
MQRILTRIDANGAGDYGVGPLRTWRYAPRVLKPPSNPLGARARPVHPIPGHRRLSWAAQQVLLLLRSRALNSVQLLLWSVIRLPGR